MKEKTYLKCRLKFRFQLKIKPVKWDFFFAFSYVQ